MREFCSTCDAEILKAHPYIRERSQPLKPCSDCGARTPREQIINSYCKPCWNVRKRGYRVKAAEREGRVLVPFISQDERERLASKRRAQKYEEVVAHEIRGGWARRWLKPFRDAFNLSETQSEEYKAEKREYYKRRYQANPERERQRSTEYKHARPEMVAKWGDKRKRLAAEQADGTLSHDEVGRLFGEAKACPYCERKLNTKNKSLDHMIAVSLGGSHSLRNVLICCRDCNLRKKAMPFAEWVETLSVSCGRRAARIYRQRYGAKPEQGALTLVWGKTG